MRFFKIYLFHIGSTNVGKSRLKKDKDAARKATAVENEDEESRRKRLERYAEIYREKLEETPTKVHKIRLAMQAHRVSYTKISKRGKTYVIFLF